MTSGRGVIAVLMSLVVVGAAVYVAAIVLMGVFSWQGLQYSLFLADAGTLRFAVAVRVVTDTALLQVGVLTSMVLDYRDGRRQLQLRWAWLVAHVTLVRRLAMAVAWLVLSAATLACDLWHHRQAALLPVSLTGAQLRRVVADRWADVRYGIGAMWSTAGRRRWRRYRRVPRPLPLPDAATFTGMIVEGSVLPVGPPLRTWRDVPSAPAPGPVRVA